MAYGYANRCGRLGVATVTHGPGLTNTLTPG
jgi:thiamine pyrophosphate-dependent acetolactate synthase large subunit-like protein